MRDNIEIPISDFGFCSKAESFLPFKQIPPIATEVIVNSPSKFECKK